MPVGHTELDHTLVVDLEPGILPLVALERNLLSAKLGTSSSSSLVPNCFVEATLASRILKLNLVGYLLRCWIMLLVEYVPRMVET